jgi:hypothetical protein
VRLTSGPSHPGSELTSYCVGRADAGSERSSSIADSSGSSSSVGIMLAIGRQQVPSQMADDKVTKTRQDSITLICTN